MTPVERKYDLYSHDAKVNAYEIALSTLLRRLPGIRLNVPHAELRWRLNPGFRRLEALPVAWD